MVSLGNVFIYCFSAGLIILGTRVLPFVLFSKKNPPKIITFIQEYIPQVIMAVLLVYCFKDMSFESVSLSVPYISSAIAVVILHLVFKNSMASIFGGTAIFILLSHLP